MYCRYQHLSEGARAEYGCCSGLEKRCSTDTGTLIKMQVSNVSASLIIKCAVPIPATLSSCRTYIMLSISLKKDAGTFVEVRVSGADAS